MDNNALVDLLVRQGYLKTPAVIEAFRKIDRRDFVPNDFKKWAYLNQPLSIGEGQTISQPLTVAFMLELLEPRSGQNVLDVGTGSGWQAALLAEIVGPGGRVTSVERIDDLSRQAQKNLSKYNLANLELVVGDASLGYPAESPYDRIVAAAASDAVPSAWKEELKVGGIIVAPVGGSLFKLVKESRDGFRQEEYPGFVFVPLVKDD